VHAKIREINPDASTLAAERRPRIKLIFNEVLETLQALGAILVDPAGLEIPEEAGDGEWEVLLFEFRHDLNRYLAAGRVDPAVDTLAEIIEFNRAPRPSPDIRRSHSRWETFTACRSDCPYSGSPIRRASS